MAKIFLPFLIIYQVRAAMVVCIANHSRSLFFSALLVPRYLQCYSSAAESASNRVFLFKLTNSLHYFSTFF